MKSKLPSPASPSEAVLRLERSTRRLWTAGIIGFFALQALLWTVAIWITARDPSFAVHSDYESRAERWNEVVRSARASDRLGWSLSVAAPPERSPAPATLVLTLLDDAGHPVEGATLRLRLFHQARAGKVQELSFSESTPGVYWAEAALDRPGFWRFAGEIRRDNELLVVNHTERF